MSFFTQRLRNGIRSGVIRCRCITKPDHLLNCEWNTAVQMLYARERAEEAALTTERGDSKVQIFKNETIDQRLSITRTHRFATDPQANHIVLPGHDIELDETVYVLETQYSPLSEEDKIDIANMEEVRRRKSAAAQASLEPSTGSQIDENQLQNTTPADLDPNAAQRSVIEPAVSTDGDKQQAAANETATAEAPSDATPTTDAVTPVSEGASTGVQSDPSPTDQPAEVTSV